MSDDDLQLFQQLNGEEKEIIHDLIKEILRNPELHFSVPQTSERNRS